MIVLRQPDLISNWLVAFFEQAKYRFAWLVPGRFKHVYAYGYSDACRTWVLYDVTLLGTRIYVLPDGPSGIDNILRWTAGATVLKPKPRDIDARRPWLGFYCVPAVKHLVGCRCGATLTPTGLYRALISEGAEIVQDGRKRCPDAGRERGLGRRSESGAGC